jgi:hypothetical protein
MRTIFNTSFALASVILRSAENETGSTLPLPSGSPAIGARIIEAKQPVPEASAIAAFVAADGAKRAAKQAEQKAARESAATDTSKRKLTGKAAKPATTGKPSDKPAKPAKPAEPAKPATHEMRGTYNGASPTFRMHGRKLSPIVLDRIPGSFTERDAAFLLDLYRKHVTKPFSRFDADAGNVSRAIGHGYLRHASGSLDSRTATFAITERYVRERQQSAKAKPAKPSKA